jgi:uncharacterized protein YdeI (BOF family)
VKIIKIVPIVALLASPFANAFDLNDAVNTLDNVNKAANQLNEAKPQVKPTTSAEVKPITTSTPVNNSEQKENSVTQKASYDCDTLVEKAGELIKKIRPNREIFQDISGAVGCKKMPNDQNLSILAIPLLPLGQIEDGRMTINDLEILIVKNDSAEIVSSSYEEAVSAMTYAMSVDTANYKLNDNTRAFGIEISNKEGNDYATNLSLYVVKDKNILKVASNIGTQIYHNFQSCSEKEKYDSLKRTIVVTATPTDGYNDLLINEKIDKEKQVSKTKHNDDCDVKKISSSTKKYTLKYDGTKGIYNVPKEVSASF